MFDKNSTFSLSSTKIYYYILGIVFITVASIIGNKLKSYIEPGNDQDEMIKKYLLDDNRHANYPSASSSSWMTTSKPNLWIHTKYEKNARKWDHFHSRTNTNLNQPFINLTVETIVNHCNDDFRICLIDDESFSVLLPHWKLVKGQMTRTPEPIKSHLRKEAILQLLFHYGGIVVPNSFISFKNLRDLYDNMLSVTKKPFVTEMVNNTFTNRASTRQPAPHFAPSMEFMGAVKNDPVIAEMATHLESIHAKYIYDCEADFLGIWNQWCIQLIHSEKKIDLVTADRIGLKTRKGLPVTVESLFEEPFLNLADDKHDFLGIYLPAQEILARTKYQWFTVLSKDEIYKSNAIVAKYILAALVETHHEYLRLGRKRHKTLTKKRPNTAI